MTNIFNGIFNGTENFKITVIDSEGAEDEQTISVTVNPINDSPIAKLIEISITEECLTPIYLNNSINPDQSNLCVGDFINGIN